MTAKAPLAMRSQFGATHCARGRDHEAEHGNSFARIRRSLASTSSRVSYLFRSKDGRTNSPQIEYKRTSSQIVQKRPPKFRTDTNDLTQGSPMTMELSATERFYIWKVRHIPILIMVIRRTTSTPQHHLHGRAPRARLRSIDTMSPVLLVPNPTIRR